MGEQSERDCRCTSVFDDMPIQADGGSSIISMEDTVPEMLKKIGHKTDCIRRDLREAVEQGE